AKTGTIRQPSPAASMAVPVSDAHANSSVAVKRFRRPVLDRAAGTRLEKQSSSAPSFLGSTGRQPHRALGPRLQETLRQPLVIDRAREDHRAHHGRENHHGFVAGLIVIALTDLTDENVEMRLDPGFE